MGARPRRRWRTAPRRRVRRWLRRQDSLTRILLVSVALLSVTVAALFYPLLNDDRQRRGTERAARTASVPRDTPQLRRTAPAPLPATAANRGRRTQPPDAAPAPKPPPPVPPPRARTTPPATVAAPGREAAQPRAAIVIDDLGQRLEHLEEIARLELPVSVAVIPGLPATARTVTAAARHGIEVLLHQPMEPHEEGGKNPGPGVLLVSMAPAELRAQLRRGLDAIPGAVGVNNHMGSRFTEDPAALALMMGELKSRGLFWLDSRTTAASLGAATARASGVPAIERDVFIDAERDPAFIRAQLRLLLQQARRHGTAVGIGHPRPETLAALRELRAELLASGVALVPVSRLVPAPAATVAALEAPARPAPAAQASAVSGGATP